MPDTDTELGPSAIEHDNDDDNNNDGDDDNGDNDDASDDGKYNLQLTSKVI